MVRMLQLDKICIVVVERERKERHTTGFERWVLFIRPNSGAVAICVSATRLSCVYGRLRYDFVRGWFSVAAFPAVIHLSVGPVFRELCVSFRELMRTPPYVVLCVFAKNFFYFPFSFAFFFVSMFLYISGEDGFARSSRLAPPATNRSARTVFGLLFMGMSWFCMYRDQCPKTPRQSSS